jgi:hypothetical protein
LANRYQSVKGEERDFATEGVTGEVLLDLAIKRGNRDIFMMNGRQAPQVCSKRTRSRQPAACRQE